MTKVEFIARNDMYLNAAGTKTNDPFTQVVRNYCMQCILFIETVKKANSTRNNINTNTCAYKREFGMWSH